MVVVATPTILAATSGDTIPTGAVPAATTVPATLFRPVSLRQLFLRGRPEDGVGGLVMGHPQSLDEGKSRDGSRVFGIGGTIHVSPGRLL